MPDRWWKRTNTRWGLCLSCKAGTCIVHPGGQRLHVAVELRRAGLLAPENTDRRCLDCSEWNNGTVPDKRGEECFDPMREGQPHRWAPPEFTEEPS